MCAYSGYPKIATAKGDLTGDGGSCGDPIYHYHHHTYVARWPATIDDPSHMIATRNAISPSCSCSCFGYFCAAGTKLPLVLGKSGGIALPTSQKGAPRIVEVHGDVAHSWDSECGSKLTYYCCSLCDHIVFGLSTAPACAE